MVTVIEMASLSAAFDASLPSYIEYSESAAGQLRYAVIRHHLQERLLPSGRLLDVGGGTGHLAADLARDGQAVTLLDFSPAMLEEARRHCAGLGVRLIRATADEIGMPFAADIFDAVLCHSLLEFVDDPPGLLAQLVRVLRRPGRLSVVFGNRYHAPLQEIILRRDARRARRGLDEELPGMDRFGLPRRTFYPETIRRMVESVGLSVIGEYGIRVFSDLIGGMPEAPDELLALELAASARMPYRQMARFIQLIAEKE